MTFFIIVYKYSASTSHEVLMSMMEAWPLVLEAKAPQEVGEQGIEIAVLNHGWEWVYQVFKSIEIEDRAVCRNRILQVFQRSQVNGKGEGFR
jgi:uncharacterized membrane protein YqiK